MKSFKMFLFCIIIFLLSYPLYSHISHGTVKEGLVMESKILQERVRYTIYLPCDYETSNRFYPAVYLLQGYTDNDTGWIQFGEAHMLTDEAVSGRIIPPMILVMPDAGVTWYINNYDNSVRYEGFFFEEFIPYIESTYKIRSDPEKIKKNFPFK